MADWRLFYSGAVSGDLLGELPFLSAKHTDTLNGTGSWSAVVPFDQPDSVVVPDGLGGVETIDRSAAADFTDLSVGTTIVYFERGGIVLGQGMVWGIELDYEAGTMTLSGAGLGSYYQRRLMPTVDYQDQDQLTIVQNVMSLVSSLDIDVVCEIAVSGVLRDRATASYEAKPVLEFIDQLANVEDGFDYRFRAHRESGAIVRRLHLDYPATGRTTDIVLEVGRNAAVFAYSEDGADMATSVLALGAGEGDDKLRETESFVPTAELPIMETSIAYLDVTDEDTLTSHAERRLQRGRNPMRRLALTLVPDVEPALGSFDVGDRLYVRARQGWLQVADYFRVVELSIGVDGNGEQATVTLAGAEAFE